MGGEGRDLNPVVKGNKRRTSAPRVYGRGKKKSWYKARGEQLWAVK